MNSSSEQTCPGCGRGNSCAVVAGQSASACWCMGSTSRLPVPTGDSACYCATCLRAFAEKLQDRDIATNA